LPRSEAATWTGSNETSRPGSPLLSYAVGEAKYSTVGILLEKGADLYKMDADGSTPLGDAKRRKDRKMVELLQNHAKMER
jgi:hypothetical protein